MRLYWIRHGETDWNRARRLQGRTDIPLNENGVAVARATAAGMARVGLRFDRVYASPLARARETAHLICPGQDVWVDERLREMSFGALEGTCYRAVDQLPMPAPGGGESSEAVQRRVVSFLDEVTAGRTGEQRVLVSAHGAVIRSLLMYLKAIPHERFWEGTVSRNCGVTVLEAVGGRVSLLAEDVVFYGPDAWTGGRGSDDVPIL